MGVGQHTLTPALRLLAGIGVVAAHIATASAAASAPAADVVISPKAYAGPLRNPLMGFIGPPNGRQEYATLAREYVKWNQIEQSAEDSADKLRAYADAHWRGVAERNIKVIPRVFLEWPKGSGVKEYWPIISYWPPDLPRDFDSAQFKQRVVRMIAKMGEAWDDDPRIAFIEMGMIGPWGEQHHPSPDAEMQKLMGDAYKSAFKHKLVMNRYPWEFRDYEFGVHWDSFGNPGWEMSRHVPELEGRLAERWRTAPMAGEMAFSLDPKVTVPRLAMSPTEAAANHADTLIRYIRRWHWTALGWVSNYDPKDPAAARGAARIQAAFGYRFVIDRVRYPSRVEPGAVLPVTLAVRNLGSAPLYYNWPLEVSLLDEKSHQPVWRAVFTNLDIRRWLPGDFSDKGQGKLVGDKAHAGFEWNTGLDYDIAPRSNEVAGRFQLPESIPPGQYILALAILDPAGNLPCVKFAIENYFQGGFHPIGRLALGVPPAQAELDPASFDNPRLDNSLHYVATPAVSSRDK
jgi:hypothetical protein